MRAASFRAARVVDPPTKLALLERLLGVMDVEECIDSTLAWLASNTGADEAICALSDSETGLLSGVGGRRVTEVQIASISAALDDTSDPFVRAMQSSDPTMLGVDVGAGTRSDLFDGAAYWALPLATRGPGQPAGGVLL